ncbi:MAG: translation initiation factor IF-2, partial [Elusimicrobiota bacterium]|nr:translation initiation factor IF-2 [Elusimicrobiota bacterium]
SGDSQTTGTAKRAGRKRNTAVSDAAAIPSNITDVAQEKNASAQQPKAKTSAEKTKSGVSTTTGTAKRAGRKRNTAVSDAAATPPNIADVAQKEKINIAPIEPKSNEQNPPEKTEEKQTVKEKINAVAEQTPPIEEPPVESAEPSPKTPQAEQPRIRIEINELTNVRELSDKMNIKPAEIMKKLISLGSLSTINQRLDADLSILLASEFGYDAVLSSIYSEEMQEIAETEDPSKLKQRSPIVTIMGHVDHGKTSLLDTLRKSNIAQKEYGGITQHIGAYKVKTAKGDYITFLDTPGHEAFTAMRSRGAQVTDIVVLVVSAADGVMPQTVEAINHAKDAGVPIIVAINKIDLPTADSQKVKQSLTSYGLVAEDWGGDAIMVEISAKKQINIDLLLEMILLKAEMMELKANPDRAAEGIVVEAKLDSKKGTTATLLVKKGTLKTGDNIIVGSAYGKIRAMFDEYGQRIQEAPPSSPVEVLGISEPPQSGDRFAVVPGEHQAREIARARKEKIKLNSQRRRRHLSLEDISAGKTKNLKIILKADVQGSLGALCDALERMSTNEIDLKIIHRGAGAITESDISLAAASDAMIVGFNLRPDAAVEKIAENEGISIRVYRIIYDLIADVKAAMEGLLDPTLKEKILGRASVKQVFKLSSSGSILGCFVTEGSIERKAAARLLRDNVIIFEGAISSLKRFKDDVKEVEKGYECGIGLENFSDVKEGDVIENFITEKIARKLE